MFRFFVSYFLLICFLRKSRHEIIYSIFINLYKNDEIDSFLQTLSIVIVNKGVFICANYSKQLTRSLLQQMVIKFDILSETCFTDFLLKFILVRNKRLSGILKFLLIYKTNIQKNKD